MKFLKFLAVAGPAVAGAVKITGGSTVIEINGKSMDIYPEELKGNDCAHLLWKPVKITTASGKSATVSESCTESTETGTTFDSTIIACPLSGAGAGGVFSTIVSKYKATDVIDAAIFGKAYTMSADALKINFQVTWPSYEASEMTISTEATFKSLPSSYDQGGLVSWVQGSCGASLSGIQEIIGNPSMVFSKQDYSSTVMKSFRVNFVSDVKIEFPKAVTVTDGSGNTNQVVSMTKSSYTEENCEGSGEGTIPTAVCLKFVVPAAYTKIVIDPPISAEPGVLSKGISLTTIIVLAVIAVIVLLAACVLCCYCCKCCKCCCCYGKCDYCLAICRK